MKCSPESSLQVAEHIAREMDLEVICPVLKYVDRRQRCPNLNQGSTVLTRMKINGGFTLQYLEGSGIMHNLSVKHGFNEFAVLRSM
jgi:hypothetical protein